MCLRNIKTHLVLRGFTTGTLAPIWIQRRVLVHLATHMRDFAIWAAQFYTLVGRLTPVLAQNPFSIWHLGLGQCNSLTPQTEGAVQTKGRRVRVRVREVGRVQLVAGRQLAIGEPTGGLGSAPQQRVAAGVPSHPFAAMPAIAKSRQS